MSDPLLRELADVLSLVDPLPGRVRGGAEAAGVLLGRAFEVWELVAGPAVLVRGTVRVWRGEQLVVEVGDRISGLVAAPVGRLELHSAAGVVDVPVDAGGGFSAELPDGLVRLVLHRDGVAPLVTRWFR